MLTLPEHLISPFDGGIMLFLFCLPILPVSGQAFYRSTVLVLVALIYGLLLALTNVCWDGAPVFFVFGLLVLTEARVGKHWLCGAQIYVLMSLPGCCSQGLTTFFDVSESVSKYTDLKSGEYIQQIKDFS